MVFHNSENETSRNQEFAFILPDPLPSTAEGEWSGGETMCGNETKQETAHMITTKP